MVKEWEKMDNRIGENRENRGTAKQKKTELKKLKMKQKTVRCGVHIEQHVFCSRWRFVMIVSLYGIHVHFTIEFGKSGGIMSISVDPATFHVIPKHLLARPFLHERWKMMVTIELDCAVCLNRRERSAYSALAVAYVRVCVICTCVYKAQCAP